MGTPTDRGPKTPRGGRPWATPLVTFTELPATQHIAGKTPSDKINFSADELTPSGSSGS